MAEVTSQHTYNLPRRTIHPTTNHFPQPQQSIPPRIQTTSLVSPTQTSPQPSSHSHSRTLSSSNFPSPSYTQTTTITTQSQNRQAPSSATMSTMSSKGGADPVRSPSSVSVTLRRSASARSGTSFVPTSYVALMRKQKATVWCDRAQLEDPRMVAAAKAAKHRAALEVSGGINTRLNTGLSSGGSSLGVRSKITNRYNNNNPAKPIGYSANLLGTTGVPMRLSATEVGDEEKGEPDAHSDFRGQRSGSGRSSLQNSARLSAAINPRQSGRLSTSSTPPSAQSVSPIGSTPVSATTTMTNKRRTMGDDYFQHPPGNGGSGSSGEEARFGDVGDMQGPKAQKEGKSADELARRGSVDERSSTLRGAVRLFVANPDLSD